MKIGKGASGAPDTIFAVASGIGRTAVAVIRISGRATASVLAGLLPGPLPAPRRASLRRLRDPASSEILDQALVLWLPGPGTFTGEDQAELQIHGSPAVRAALLRVLSDQPGCRPAEPGEFTRRAFANGKLDLSAVEGLADLIDAETEAQRRQAIHQLEGRLATEVEAWRERLLAALAACDAALDFSDEDDVPDDVAASAAGIAASVRAEVALALSESSRGERVREGFQVVIAGAPNAGKSTLLNALARRDVAIVSPVPGTTRDIIEIRCDLSGLPVTFVDTAGLRASGDLIEREGMVRARQRMDRADLVLWLEASDEAPRSRTWGNDRPHRHAEERPRVPSRSTQDDGVSFETPAAQALQGEAVGSYGRGPRDEDEGDFVLDLGLVGRHPTETAGPRTWILATKTDIGLPSPDADLRVSAVTGQGLPELLDRIQAIAAEDMTGASDAVLTRERHRRVLTDVVDCLDRAVLVGQGSAIELLAEDLRLALRHLGRITGAVDVEDVLDRIFASFCIGK